MKSQTVTVHGHSVSYRSGGSGPLVLLIHGMAGSSTSWKPALDELGEHVSYLAPDLLGHGQSDKPRGDYSLGAYASFLRDFLSELGHESATIVGTSLGGGIAMQLAYQHPQCCERLVLVGAGGLGDEVMPLLRAMTLPGAEFVMPVVTQPVIRHVVETITGWFGAVGLRPDALTQELWRSYSSLSDAATRTAFLYTLRSVVDHSGQRVSALDKLYLAQEIPTLIVWGDEDPIIPVSHAHDAHAAIAGSVLKIMHGTGHFPYVEQPEEFAEAVGSFVNSTPAAHLTHEDLIKRRSSGPRRIA